MGKKEKVLKFVLLALGGVLVAAAQMFPETEAYHDILTGLGAFLTGSQAVRRLGDG